MVSGISSSVWFIIDCDIIVIIDTEVMGIHIPRYERLAVL